MGQYVVLWQPTGVENIVGLPGRLIEIVPLPDDPLLQIRENAKNLFHCIRLDVASLNIGTQTEENGSMGSVAKELL